MKNLFILITLLNILYASKIELKRNYYESGEINSITRYVDGKIDGESKYFYKNGNVKSITIFADGEREGISKFFYENGEPSYILEYKNNKRYGTTTFYPQNQDFYSTSTLKEGEEIDNVKIFFKDKTKKDGNIRIESDDGLSYSQCSVKDNMLDGLCIDVYHSQKEVREYKKGRLDGMYKNYYDDILDKESQYKNGKKNGVEKKYYKSGILKSIAYYKNGILSKEMKRFNEDGSLKSKFIIQDNNKTIGYIYNKQHKQIATINLQTKDLRNGIYFNKKVDIEHKSYYDNGKLKYIIKLNRGIGELKAYYNNGSIKYIMPYIDSKANGKTKFFDINSSNIRAVINFTNNNKNGKSIIYYKDSNQTVKYRLNYKKNNLVGKKTRYLRDGKIDYTLSYRDNYIYLMDKIEFRDINSSRVVYYDNKHTEYNITKNIIRGYYYNGDIEYQINYKKGKKSGISQIYYGVKRFDDIKALSTYYMLYHYNYSNIIKHSLRQDIEFKNDKLNGTTKIYDIDGKLESTIEYQNNLKNGNSIKYSKNKKREISYLNDKKDGVERLYINGMLSEEKEYKNGIKDGKHRFYHSNGNLSREVTYKNGKRDGVYRIISSDGELFYEDIYKDNKILYEVEVLDE